MTWRMHRDNTGTPARIVVGRTGRGAKNAAPACGFREHVERRVAEVVDEKPSTGAQHPGQLGNRLGGVIPVVRGKRGVTTASNESSGNRCGFAERSICGA
jgi:hypothetical protein